MCFIHWSSTSVYVQLDVYTVISKIADLSFMIDTFMFPHLAILFLRVKYLEYLFMPQTVLLNSYNPSHWSTNCDINQYQNMWNVYRHIRLRHVAVMSTWSVQKNSTVYDYISLLCVTTGFTFSWGKCRRVITYNLTFHMWHPRSITWYFIRIFIKFGVDITQQVSTSNSYSLNICTR